MLKKLKCLEAKARLAREIANSQGNNNNSDSNASTTTVILNERSGSLNEAPRSPNQCSSTSDTVESSSSTSSSSVRLVKTEPVDYEILNLEKNYNERAGLSENGQEISKKTTSTNSFCNNSHQQSTNSNNNINVSPPVPHRYQHVQVQTVPPRQGLSSNSFSSNSLNSQMTAHKVILTPRLDYLQTIHSGNNNSTVASGSDKNCTVTPHIIITRTLTSNHNNSTVTSSSAATSSSSNNQQPHHHQQLQQHISRRNSTSPLHYQRLLTTAQTQSSAQNSNSAPSSPPPLRQNSSHIMQHVRVIQNGRYYDDTLGIANGARRQSASPPPLQHYTRTVPVTVTSTIETGGPIRRYVPQTQTSLPPPPPPPFSTPTGSITDNTLATPTEVGKTEQRTLLPVSKCSSSSVNGIGTGNGNNIGTSTSIITAISSDSSSESSSGIGACSGASTSAGAGQQYLLAHTPTRKYVLAPPASRQINVISTNHTISPTPLASGNPAQLHYTQYAQAQHSPSATTSASASVSPLSSSSTSHHSSQYHKHNVSSSVAPSSTSSCLTFSPTLSSSSKASTAASAAFSNHIFRTPVVSSSSGHHLHHTHQNHHNNTATTTSHYPLSPSSSHQSPNPSTYHQSSNNNSNTNNNSTNSNNINNNNNTVMRPPPPPPPPKIKHSTLGLNGINGPLGIGGSGGLGGNSINNSTSCNHNNNNNNNNNIGNLSVNHHINGLRSAATTSLPSSLSPLTLTSSSSPALTTATTTEPTAASGSARLSSLPSCSPTMNLNNNCEEPSSSIPDLEFDGTTVLCRVCGDKASGFHYGVHSCEGCKGFFRRSIQQKIQYRPCTKNQQCSILRINRNRCQYCRLKKCIAVGMSRDAVRFGRVPKREKARIMAAMQQSTQNRGQQNALVTELDDQPRLMATVLRAHLDTCEFTREKVAALRQQACECPTYSMPTLLACPLNPAPEFSSEMEFSQRFAYVIRGIIDFASKIPGFQFLNQDDKFTLLKAGLFDALFVRLFYMFDSTINSIICLNGEVIRRDDIQNGTNARFLVDSTFKFAERMNSMNLSDAEIGLFCAIVLFTPDRPGLRNVELIEKMYTSLKGCLQTIINQNRPDQPDFMNTLLDTIPDLRTLSTLHTEKLVVFRTEHKDLLRQQICPDDNRSPPPKSPQTWEDNRMDVEAKSPLGSVSSTESGDMDYQTASSTAPALGSSSPSNAHHNEAHYQQPSSLASTAPLLAATLSGTNVLRNRANSGSSGDSNGDLDLVGPHAHLTQNGLTITPIIRTHTHQQLHQQQHHLNPSSAGGQHRYRKLDSPTDSGIESGNEKNECKAVSSGGSSSCSSPRSSVDDVLDCPDATTSTSTTTTIATTTQVNLTVSPIRSPQPTTAAASSTSGAAITSNSGTNPTTSTLKRQIVEDMPVLKRVLQAPPLYDTNSLMDEAYKPHKKFRALRHREYETFEADASSSTNTNNTISSNHVPVGSPVHQRASIQSQASVGSTPSSGSSNTAGQVSTISAQTSPSPLALSTPSSPPSTTHHQSQLHIQLSRPTSTNSNLNSNSTHEQQQSTNIHPPLQAQQPQQQQQQHSSLSSTHSVLAKSLMAEPRMTPEQMKRSDIIQNYIMRDTSNSSLRVCSPHGSGSRSPATQHLGISNHNYATSAGIGNTSPASSSSPNSNCPSPSRNQVTSMASPPPTGTGPATGQISGLQRWQGHSVITTTSINQRQPSVSPSSNGSSSSTSSNNSNASSSNNSGCPYFQSPHSTSASVSPPRTSPSSNHHHQHQHQLQHQHQQQHHHHHTSPRLLELQVDIADSQQPLNLSKKSPTPPPNKLQALVAAATAAQRYPQVVTPDITVTATTTSILNDPSNTTGPITSNNNNNNNNTINNTNNNSNNNNNNNNNPQVQVHKVMLEA